VDILVVVLKPTKLVEDCLYSSKIEFEIASSAIDLYTVEMSKRVGVVVVDTCSVSPDFVGVFSVFNFSKKPIGFVILYEGKEALARYVSELQSLNSNFIAISKTSIQLGRDILSAIKGAKDLAS
jgi:hypothetical protein